jgi:hypothetical protein
MSQPSPREIRWREAQRERERARKRKLKAKKTSASSQSAVIHFNDTAVPLGKFTFSIAEYEAVSYSIAKFSAPDPLPVSEQLQLMPLRFEVTHFRDTGSNVILQAKVHDVSGSHDSITFTLPIVSDLRGKARAMRVRKLLAWALMHELNECLRYQDGTPVIDPHPERGTWRAHPDIERMGVVAGQITGVQQ